MAQLSKRVIFVLACQECKDRNYTTSKNKDKQKDRLELKKYCPRCRKHTEHRESK
ncbi:MAG: 50S ribosomal protein L33 [Armatimonadetes bacterium]|nr:50S ribosomal protein L33 [Armatimonadota bacterium]